MKALPSAIDAATKVIEDNPELFNSNIATLSVMSLAMVDYAKECLQSLKEDFTPGNLFGQMAEIAKKDAKERFNINL